MPIKSDYSVLRGLKYIEASFINILFRLAPVIAFVASIILLKEQLTLKKASGMTLTVAAALIIAEWKGTLIHKQALMLAILCATSLGLAWTIDKFVSGSVEASTYSLVIWTLPILYIYLPSLSTASIHLELKQGSWKIPLVACMNVAGYYLKLRALSLADASRVIPIATSHVVLVVFGGIIFLKETTNIRKKLIAGAMVFAGIMLLR